MKAEKILIETFHSLLAFQFYDRSTMQNVSELMACGPCKQLGAKTKEIKSRSSENFSSSTALLHQQNPQSLFTNIISIIKSLVVVVVAEEKQSKAEQDKQGRQESHNS